MSDMFIVQVSGHSRPVSDVKWNPFNDNIVASGSEDCTIKLWYIPDGGLQVDIKYHQPTQLKIDMLDANILFLISLESLDVLRVYRKISL